MRILLFGPYPQPGGGVTGGVMAVVHALARSLARRPGVQVAVAAAYPGEEERVEQDGDITIYRLAIPRLPRTRGHRRIRRKLVDAAHDFRPTIVHAHGAGYYAAAALDGFWPVILTMHGVIHEEARRSQPRGLKDRLAWQYDARMEARVLQRARYVIAISPYIRQIFSHHPHLQWFDIPNPVDDPFFEIQRRAEAGRLFTPARIIPRKGIDALLRAFAAIVADFPQATLRIAGESDSMPDYAAECRRIAAEADVGHRVHFLGNLNRDALLEEYSRAAGVVLPARQETAPVAIEEALAAGCPVIATRVGGVPWMVSHGENGLLTPPDDIDALAAALARLLTGGEETAAWSENARASAAPYRLAAVTDATLDAYQRVLAGG